MTTKYQVMLLHRNHPDWSASRIARELGCHSAYVRSTAARNNLKIPRATVRITQQEETLLMLGRACRRAGLRLADVERMADSAMI
jgi:hypothetical protein